MTRENWNGVETQILQRDHLKAPPKIREIQISLPQIPGKLGKTSPKIGKTPINTRTSKPDNQNVTKPLYKLTTSLNSDWL